MTLIERATRALCVGLPDEDGYQDACCGKCGRWVEKAREVLEAIREPSDAMVDAGLPQVQAIEVEEPDIRDVWQAMIDAALEETAP